LRKFLFLRTPFIITEKFFRKENMPPEISPEVDYSPQLQHLLSRSAQINSYYEKDFDVSFSSLLLAFLLSEDIVSQWFQAYVKSAEIDVQKILEESGLNQEIMEDILRATLLDLQPARMTTSARRYLQTAEEFRHQLAGRIGARPLDTHHLMAVFIYQPWVHEKDLMRWGFDRESWSDAFLELMRGLAPKELGFWTLQHRRDFGQEAKPPGEDLSA
jgi:hypothetical protein